MTVPLWIVYGMIVGLFGYVIDPEKSYQNLIGGTMLGMVGAAQGMFLSTILSTIPVVHYQPSPLFLSFVGALLLLSLGKITRKAF